eukprot:1328100-Rhodomonas_salina.1
MVEKLGSLVRTSYVTTSTSHPVVAVVRATSGNLNPQAFGLTRTTRTAWPRTIALVDLTPNVFLRLSSQSLRTRSVREDRDQHWH